MYTFEFNDNLYYRNREDLADELRELADRVESHCHTFPSCKFNAPAGWLHDDRYDGGFDDEEYENDRYYGEDDE